MIGGTDRQIEVQLDPDAMRSYGISPAQVSAALARENQEVPAGRIYRGDVEKLVRVTGRIVNPLAFGNIVVATKDNVPVHVRDVGTVVDGSAEARSAAYLNDTRSVSVEVLKVSGSNTVEVADAVRAMITDLQGTLPSDIEFTIVRDDSIGIRHSLSDVQITIMLGAVLTIFIIYLFLNSWRSTVITGLTLPVSVISAFFAMWIFGFTINTMTLLALSLAIGLLIDDAIVVRENIVRHIEMGKDHYRASMEATDEIGLAVLSTTMAVVAVFIPVAFMGGQIGKIFFQFGVTVAFAVLVSLFVSFTLDPMLSSVWSDPEIEHGGHAETRKKTRNPIRRFAFAFDDAFERTADRYRNALGWALRHRLTVIVVAALSIGAAFAIYPLLGFTWIPDYDAGEFNVSFRAPPGSRIEYTTDKGLAIGAVPARTAGGGSSRSSRWAAATAAARTTARCTCASSRAASAQRSQQANRDRPAAQARRDAQREAVDPGTAQHLRRRRTAADPDLRAGAGGVAARSSRREQVLEAVSNVPGITEATSSDEGEIPQLDVEVDRQQAWAAGLGIAVDLGHAAAALPGTACHALGGPQRLLARRAGDLSRLDARLAQDVERIPVLSNNIDLRTGQAVDGPAGAGGARSRAGVGPQQIDRRNLERQISLSVGVLPGYNVGDVANAARTAIASIGLPRRLSHRVRRRRAEPRGDEGLRAGGDHPRGRLHLPHPGVAVRVVHPAAGDHAGAPALVRRRGAGAAGHAGVAQHDVDDRHHHAHGAGDQERHPDDRLREPAARRAAWSGARRC